MFITDRISLLLQIEMFSFVSFSVFFYFLLLAPIAEREQWFPTVTPIDQSPIDPEQFVKNR
jgi:hypothetical protein